MKHSPFETLIQKAGRQVELSTAEREKMRFVLREYAAFKPRRAQEPATLPAYQAILTEWWAFIRRPASSLALAALFIVVASGGVAVAAEGTFPGDALYSVKVALLEPVRTSLMLSSEARAAWQRTLAERRMNEAAMLAQRGTLNAATEIILRANFEQNANAAAESSEQSQSAGTADISSENFVARLAAYESVLTQIDNAKGLNTTGALRSAIRSHIEREASTIPEDVPGDLRLKEAANSALGASANLLGSVNDVLATTASSHAREAFEDAQALTRQGNELFKEQDTEGASRAFRRSLEATARLDVLTRAAATLEVDAFTTEKEN